MAFMQWEPKFEMGLEVVDQQHKKLFDLINQLFDAAAELKAHEKTRQVLDELIQYTITHFKTEEKLFRDHGYPEAAAHLEEHRYLTNQVMIFKGQYDEGTKFVTGELMEFLEHWLMDHIVSADLQYAAYIHRQIHQAAS